MKRKRGRIGEDTEQTDEALDFSQRRARAITMKRNKKKLALGRKRAERKTADKDRLAKRARRQAINTVYDKMTQGKGRDEVSISRKKEIEKRIEKQKPKVDRLAKKLLRKVRKDERDRRSGGGDK